MIPLPSNYVMRQDVLIMQPAADHIEDSRRCATVHAWFFCVFLQFFEIVFVFVKNGGKKNFSQREIFSTVDGYSSVEN